MRIAVEPGVFVPRRRTEFLVDLAVALRPRVLVDLCCGTGAIAAAVAARVVGVEVHAADCRSGGSAMRRAAMSPARCISGSCTTRSRRELRGRVDVLAVNAPYVPSARGGT